MTESEHRPPRRTRSRSTEVADGNGGRRRTDHNLSAAGARRRSDQPEGDPSRGRGERRPTRGVPALQRRTSRVARETAKVANLEKVQQILDQEDLDLDASSAAGRKRLLEAKAALRQENDLYRLSLPGLRRTTTIVFFSSLQVINHRRRLQAGEAIELLPIAGDDDLERIRHRTRPRHRQRRQALIIIGISGVIVLTALVIILVAAIGRGEPVPEAVGPRPVAEANGGGWQSLLGGENVWAMVAPPATAGTGSATAHASGQGPTSNLASAGVAEPPPVVRVIDPVALWRHDLERDWTGFAPTEGALEHAMGRHRLDLAVDLPAGSYGLWLEAVGDVLGTGLAWDGRDFRALTAPTPLAGGHWYAAGGEPVSHPGGEFQWSLSIAGPWRLGRVVVAQEQPVFSGLAAGDSGRGFGLPVEAGLVGIHVPAVAVTGGGQRPGLVVRPGGGVALAGVVPEHGRDIGLPTGPYHLWVQAVADPETVGTGALVVQLDGYRGELEGAALVAATASAGWLRATPEPLELGGIHRLGLAGTGVRLSLSGFAFLDPAVARPTDGPPAWLGRGPFQPAADDWPAPVSPDLAPRADAEGGSGSDPSPAQPEPRTITLPLSGAGTAVAVADLGAAAPPPSASGSVARATVAEGQEHLRLPLAGQDREDVHGITLLYHLGGRAVPPNLALVDDRGKALALGALPDRRGTRGWQTAVLAIPGRQSDKRRGFGEPVAISLTRQAEQGASPFLVAAIALRTREPASTDLLVLTAPLLVPEDPASGLRHIARRRRDAADGGIVVLGSDSEKTALASSLAGYCQRLGGSYRVAAWDDTGRSLNLERGLGDRETRPRMAFLVPGDELLASGRTLTTAVRHLDAAIRTCRDRGVLPVVVRGPANRWSEVEPEDREAFWAEVRERAVRSHRQRSRAWHGFLDLGHVTVAGDGTWGSGSIEELHRAIEAAIRNLDQLLAND